MDSFPGGYPASPTTVAFLSTPGVAVDSASHTRWRGGKAAPAAAYAANKGASSLQIREDLAIFCVSFG